jgi:putative transposase
MAFNEKLSAVKNMRTSMDGRGRTLALDNVFIDRLWRNVKYEYVYLYAPGTGKELWASISHCFIRYNYQRPHQSLEYRTPAQVCFQADAGKMQNQ